MAIQFIYSLICFLLKKMYTIRIQKKRRHKVKYPSYYIVVLPKHKGIATQRFTSKLGSYNLKNKQIVLNINNFIYWIQKGALISNKVYTLLNYTTKFISNPKNKNVIFKYINK